MINVEELAIPLAGDNPAGENREYDPLYLEMDALAVAVPESQMGESRIEGRGPDWRKLRENCLALWGRTRDLRVASYLAVAETATAGLAGCAAAFKLILFLTQDMWDTMYPRLDPEEDNDPTERLNILSMLSPEPGAFNDPIMFITKFRMLRLVPQLPYTLRDYLISINELETSGEPVDPYLIKGELMRIPLAEIEAQAACARELKKTVEALCADCNKKLSDAHTLAMPSLSGELDKLCAFYASYLESYSADTENAEMGETGDKAAAEPAAAPNTAGLSGQALNIALCKPASRAEALLLLRKGSEYFQQQEPNSPIPLLVNRALRFSEMNFIDLIADIVPDALPRGKEILGIKEEL